MSTDEKLVKLLMCRMLIFGICVAFLSLVALGWEVFRHLAK